MIPTPKAKLLDQVKGCKSAFRPAHIGPIRPIRPIIPTVEFPFVPREDPARTPSFILKKHINMFSHLTVYRHLLYIEYITVNHQNNQKIV